MPLLSNKFSKSEKKNLTESKNKISNDDGHVEFLIIFSRKQLMSLKYRVFQITLLITIMIYLKMPSNILKITLPL